MKFRTSHRKSQTATEYILIMTVVIVISLVVVILLGGFPGIGAGTSKKVTDYQLATNAKVGVDKYYFSTSGYALATVRNNNFDTITVNNLVIAGTLCDASNSKLVGTNAPAFPLTINSGQFIIINCTDSNFSIVPNTLTPCASSTYVDFSNGASYSSTLYGTNCLYLGPSYYITYNGTTKDSGSVPTDSNGYVAGTSVTVLGQGTLTKSGNTFIGWNTNSDGSGISRGVGTTFSMGSGNVTLYAMWTTNTTYNVIYNGSNSDSGSAPIDTNNYVNGMNVTVLGQGTLTKGNSDFAGWNTLANGSGINYTAGSIFAIGPANQTLYSQWVLIGDPGYYVCTGSTPGNATLCSGDDAGLLENTAINLTGTCGAPKCEYTCNSGYTLSGGVCVPVPVPEITIPSTLQFQCVNGDVMTLYKTLVINNSGDTGSVLSWTLENASNPANVSYSQLSGTITAPGNNTITISLPCRSTGTYTTIATISAPGITSKNVNIILEVVPLYLGQIKVTWIEYSNHVAIANSTSLVSVTTPAAGFNPRWWTGKHGDLHFGKSTIQRLTPDDNIQIGEWGSNFWDTGQLPNPTHLFTSFAADGCPLGETPEMWWLVWPTTNTQGVSWKFEHP